MNQRDAQKLATRRALSAAAIELFASTGFDETRVEDIAASAGVTARTFFLHFGSKDAAAFPDHDERVAALAASLAEAAAAGTDPIEAIAEQIIVGIRQTTDSRIRAKRYRLINDIDALRHRDLTGDLDYERVIVEYLVSLDPAPGEDAAALQFRARFVAGTAMAVARAALTTWAADPTFDPVAAASVRLQELG